MAQELKPFYDSAKWQSARRYVLQRSGGLCERCLQKGLISTARVVHHKIVLTKENVTNPDIALNPEHLEALCQDCHAAAHAELRDHRRYTVTKDGEVVTY